MCDSLADDNTRRSAWAKSSTLRLRPKGAHPTGYRPLGRKAAPGVLTRRVRRLTVCGLTITIAAAPTSSDGSAQGSEWRGLCSSTERPSIVSECKPLFDKRLAEWRNWQTLGT